MPRKKANAPPAKITCTSCCSPSTWYGGDFQDWLPSGADQQGDWDSIRVNNATYTNILSYAGNSNVWYCPDFTYGTLGVYNASFGYLIAYSYLGNVVTNQWPNSSYTWHSAQKLTEPGTNYLMADANRFGTDGELSVPHGPSGSVHNPTFYIGPTTPALTPVTAGGAGGNVGCLDGSVSWKNIHVMAPHYGSSYYEYTVYF